MKRTLCAFIVILVFSIAPHPIFASSNYVLPYPSYMPGSIFYKLHKAGEILLSYWYFGDFGQFSYNLRQSDKYLVEGKTLAEYGQYLLAYNAIQKSNVFFAKTSPNLRDAYINGKNISEKKLILTNAAQKHIEMLEKMKNEVPATFYWQPEKGTGSQLGFSMLLTRAIKERQKCL